MFFRTDRAWVGEGMGKIKKGVNLMVFRGFRHNKGTDEKFYNGRVYNGRALTTSF